jgi:hypothetical protein
MSIMDIINPWGALCRAKARIADLEADIEHLDNEHAGGLIWEQELNNRLKRAEALIAEGHFRNPETGRLGRKGVIYK